LDGASHGQAKKVIAKQEIPLNSFAHYKKLFAKKYPLGCIIARYPITN